MNIENLKKVRDLIASRPAEGITMNDWGYKLSENLCGTAGCIAGWTNVLIAMEKGGGKLVKDDYGRVAGWNGFADSEGAADYLGLMEHEKSRLFRMSANDDHVRLPSGLSFFEIAIRNNLLSHEDEKAAVLAVIDRAIETGDIDWYGVVNGMYPKAVEAVGKLW